MYTNLESSGEHLAEDGRTLAKQEFAKLPFLIVAGNQNV